MTKEITPSTPEALQKDIGAVYEKHKDTLNKSIATIVPSQDEGIYHAVETPQHKQMRMDVMKAALRHPFALKKSAISTTSNLYGYDLRAPSLHLVPWLSPLRETLPRVQHPQPATQANWKYINAANFTAGGFIATPFINEGQRAPSQNLTFLNGSAPYASMGVDSAVTYEEQSASRDFEDAMATQTFFALENLMVKEEHALLGANKTLKLGTANTPAGTSGTDMYVAVVGLTYEGYNNFIGRGGVSAGLTQQLSITTPDGKPMQVNAGCGQESAISAHLDKTHAVTVTPKTGEVAWLWYVGSSSSTSAMYIFAVTTVPSLAANAVATVPSTGQLLSALTVGDFSVNDGTTGGGSQQVTAFDGFLPQVFNNSVASPVNAYVSQFNGAKLTSSGAGGITEIDDMLEYLWNNFRTTIDVMWVNAQQLRDITKGVLNGSSAPLLRFDKDASGDHYDMTGSGTISFYFNPYIPGGKKILIMVHPTLPPGTILAYAKTLPPFFKSNSTPNVAEVITRRDYYSVQWAETTREYPIGVYAEEVLAIYAPFCMAVMTGIAPGLT